MHACCMCICVFRCMSLVHTCAAITNGCTLELGQTPKLPQVHCQQNLSLLQSRTHMAATLELGMTPKLQEKHCQPTKASKNGCSRMHRPYTWTPNTMTAPVCEQTQMGIREAEVESSSTKASLHKSCIQQTRCSTLQHHVCLCHTKDISC